MVNANNTVNNLNTLKKQILAAIIIFNSKKGDTLMVEMTYFEGDFSSLVFFCETLFPFCFWPGICFEETISL